MNLLQVLQAEKEVKGDELLEVELTDSEIEKLVSNHILTKRRDETYEIIQENTKSNLAWKLYEYYFKEKNQDLALEALNTYIKLCKEENTEIDYNKVFISKVKISNLSVSYQHVEKEKELSNSIKNLLAAPTTANTITELELLVEEFCQLNQGRNFYSDFYRGKLYAKKAQFTKAIEEFRKIVDQDPDNYIAWIKLSEMYHIINKRNEWHHAICQIYRLTAKTNPFANIEMAKIYVKEGNYKALKTQIDSIYENPNLKRIEIFQHISNYIHTRLNKINKFYDRFGYSGKARNEQEQIKEILSSIEEKMNTLLLLTSNLETKYSVEEKRYQDAYQELYDSEQDMIVPSKLLNRVKNLEIVVEEDYLLCLSAATVLFEHNMPNYAEKYLKFVATSKNKTKAVKESLNQTINNKKLYLNR